MGSVSLEPGIEKLLFAYWTWDQCATILMYSPGTPGIDRNSHLKIFVWNVRQIKEYDGIPEY